MNGPADAESVAPWYPAARALADSLVSAADGSVRHVLLYGSHLLRANPDRHSALDFIVVVDAYRPFYRAMRRADEINRWPWLMSAMARVLPPNVVAFAPQRGEAGIAKCLIVSKAHLERALGDDPPDHFLLGRMVQKLGRVWTASETEARWMDQLLARAHAGVLEWMAPYLDTPVDGHGLGRRLLEVCYSGEVRPEARNRAETIYSGQSDHFAEVFDPVLKGAAARGAMVEEEDGYRLAGPVAPRVARRWRRHFRRSKARATARWLKHTVTFDNWLPYVVRKAERHSGTKIELSVAERRWPLIFLWPRVIRFFRSRPPRRPDA